MNELPVFDNDIQKSVRSYVDRHVHYYCRVLSQIFCSAMYLASGSSHVFYNAKVGNKNLSHDGVLDWLHAGMSNSSRSSTLIQRVLYAYITLYFLNEEYKIRFRKPGYDLASFVLEKITFPTVCLFSTNSGVTLYKLLGSEISTIGFTEAAEIELINSVTVDFSLFGIYSLINNLININVADLLIPNTVTRRVPPGIGLINSNRFWLLKYKSHLLKWTGRDTPEWVVNPSKRYIENTIGNHRNRLPEWRRVNQLGPQYDHQTTLF